ncbi:MAG: hypothetical protein ACYSUY_16085 [Planctomycetota bacterium]
MQSKRIIDLRGCTFEQYGGLENSVSASVSGNERGLLLASYFAADDKMGATLEETDVV